MGVEKPCNRANLLGLGGYDQQASSIEIQRTIETSGVNYNSFRELEGLDTAPRGDKVLNSGWYRAAGGVTCLISLSHRKKTQCWGAAE